MLVPEKEGGAEDALKELTTEILSELPEGEVETPGEGAEQAAPEKPEVEPEGEEAEKPKADVDAELEAEVAKYTEGKVPVQVVKKLRDRLKALKAGHTDWEGKSKTWETTKGEYEKQLKAAYQLSLAIGKYPALDNAMLNLMKTGELDVQGLATALAGMVAEKPTPAQEKAVAALPPEVQKQIAGLEARLQERETKEQMVDLQVGFKAEVEGIKKDKKYADFKDDKEFWEDVFDLTESKAIAYDLALKSGRQGQKPPSLKEAAEKVAKGRLSFKERLLKGQEEAIPRKKGAFIPNGRGPAGEEETPAPDADIDSPEFHKWLVGGVERHVESKAAKAKT